MLLKVHKDTIPTTNNKTITQKITKEKTIERKLKSDGVDEKIYIFNKKKTLNIFLWFNILYILKLFNTYIVINLL